MKKVITICAFLVVGLTHAQENLAQNTIKGVLMGNQAQVVRVNSVAEALLHVAGANYYLASKMGFPPPEDVDMMGLSKIAGKDNIIAALKKSNEFVLDKITMVETGQLHEEVDFGFAKMNKMGGLLAMMEHNGEHKGQLIAYARSNGVVPPWSK